MRRPPRRSGPRPMPSPSSDASPRHRRSPPTRVTGRVLRASSSPAEAAAAAATATATSGQSGQGEPDAQGGRRRGRPEPARPGNQPAAQRDADDDGARATDATASGTSAAAASATGDEFETEIGEDDVLIPVAGILDVLDNYALRAHHRLPARPERRLRLARPGQEATTCARATRSSASIQQPREGEQSSRQKYNALVKVDADQRPDRSRTPRRASSSASCTPLYPQERLRLETDAGEARRTRIIDLIAPIGKGQRGLIVAPPKAGKTIILQAIANAIAHQQPRGPPHGGAGRRAARRGHRHAAHRSRARSSPRPSTAPPRTTPRSPSSPSSAPSAWSSWAATSSCCSTRITRLGRALQPGRARHPAASCPVASTHRALYPPKRFFGAARNIENGGSLTILATALVETGSKMDEVIFEEFKGTGNMRAAPVAPARRQAHLPGGRRRRVQHPPRGDAALGRRGQDHLEAAPRPRRPRPPAGARGRARRSSRRRSPTSSSSCRCRSRSRHRRMATAPPAATRRRQQHPLARGPTGVRVGPRAARRSTTGVQAELSDPAVHADAARAKRVNRRYAELRRDRRRARAWTAGDEATSGPRASWPGRTRPSRPRCRAWRRGWAAPRRSCGDCSSRATPTTARDVIMEIKSGEGGAEAALFAADLLRMYLSTRASTGLEDRAARAQRV